MEGYIGEVRLFAGNFAPRHWEFCHGQLLPISQHSALFSILGTTYGGDGRTTFALPDLRGRIAICPGEGPGLTNRRGGEKGGSETNTIASNQLPLHVSSSTVTTQSTVSTSKLTVAERTLTSTEEKISVEEVAAGYQQPVNNMQPWLGLNFIICMEGIYPSRS